MLEQVKFAQSQSSEYWVPESHIDNATLIEQRVQAVVLPEQAALRLVLSYLYLSNGPTNLTNPKYRLAESHLLSYEIILARYLKSRTNGTGRRAYGKPALLHMRSTGYKCECCGFKDVRALNLDHVHGRTEQVFFVLCANCHNIKSRLFDWHGKKRADNDAYSKN